MSSSTIENALPSPPQVESLPFSLSENTGNDAEPVSTAKTVRNRSTSLHTLKYESSKKTDSPRTRKHFFRASSASNDASEAKEPETKSAKITRVRKRSKDAVTYKRSNFIRKTSSPNLLHPSEAVLTKKRTNSDKDSGKRRFSPAIVRRFRAASSKRGRATSFQSELEPQSPASPDHGESIYDTLTKFDREESASPEELESILRNRVFLCLSKKTELDSLISHRDWQELLLRVVVKSNTECKQDFLSIQWCLTLNMIVLGQYHTLRERETDSKHQRISDELRETLRLFQGIRFANREDYEYLVFKFLHSVLYTLASRKKSLLHCDSRYLVSEMYQVSEIYNDMIFGDFSVKQFDLKLLIVEAMNSILEYIGKNSTLKRKNSRGLINSLTSLVKTKDDGTSGARKLDLMRVYWNDVEQFLKVANTVAKKHGIAELEGPVKKYSDSRRDSKGNTVRSSVMSEMFSILADT